MLLFIKEKFITFKIKQTKRFVACSLKFIHVNTLTINVKIRLYILVKYVAHDNNTVCTPK